MVSDDNQGTPSDPALPIDYYSHVAQPPLQITNILKHPMDQAKDICLGISVVMAIGFIWALINSIQVINQPVVIVGLMATVVEACCMAAMAVLSTRRTRAAAVVIFCVACVWGLLNVVRVVFLTWVMAQGVGGGWIAYIGECIAVTLYAALIYRVLRFLVVDPEQELRRMPLMEVLAGLLISPVGPMILRWTARALVVGNALLLCAGISLTVKTLQRGPARVVATAAPARQVPARPLDIPIGFPAPAEPYTGDFLEGGRMNLAMPVADRDIILKYASSELKLSSDQLDFLDEVLREKGYFLVQNGLPITGREKQILGWENPLWQSPREGSHQRLRFGGKVVDLPDPGAAPDRIDLAGHIIDSPTSYHWSRVIAERSTKQLNAQFPALTRRQFQAICLAIYHHEISCPPAALEGVFKRPATANAPTPPHALPLNARQPLRPPGHNLPMQQPVQAVPTLRGIPGLAENPAISNVSLSSDGDFRFTADGGDFLVNRRGSLLQGARIADWDKLIAPPPPPPAVIPPKPERPYLSNIPTSAPLFLCLAAVGGICLAFWLIKIAGETTEDGNARTAIFAYCKMAGGALTLITVLDYLRIHGRYSPDFTSYFADPLALLAIIVWLTGLLLTALILPLLLLKARHVAASPPQLARGSSIKIAFLPANIILLRL